MPPVNATIGCEQGTITPNAPYLPSRNNDAHRDPPLDLLARPSTTITAGTLGRPHRGALRVYQAPQFTEARLAAPQPAITKAMEKTQSRLDRHSVGGKMAGDTNLRECCNLDTSADGCSEIPKLDVRHFPHGSLRGSRAAA